MKRMKILFVTAALTLTTFLPATFSLSRPALAGGLQSYSPKKITGTEVAPVEIEPVTLNSYDPGEIETYEVTPVEIEPVTLNSYDPGEIETHEVTPVEIKPVTLNSYDPGEIETFEVTPVEIEPVTLNSYDPGEIETFEVTPVEIEPVTLYAYDPGEITNTEVTPVTDIHVAFPDYDMPDIESYAPSEIQPFYVELVGYLSDDARAQFAGLSDTEAAEIVQKQYDLIQDLNAAFADAGYGVRLDPVSGSLPIDATLLYATNEYQVTDEGKAILGGLFRVYCQVLSQEKYRDFISAVKIIGHTDSDGSYEYNQKLSLNRAEAVKAFCLSDECGVEDIEWLTSRLTAEGRSYDELIYNSDGTENKAASRRVEISFDIAIQ